MQLRLKKALPLSLDNLCFMLILIYSKEIGYLFKRMVRVAIKSTRLQSVLSVGEIMQICYQKNDRMINDYKSHHIYKCFF
jgi:hypothetical protein